MNREWCTWLTELGLRIFPVHGVRDGACTCKDGVACANTGKHPVHAGWMQEATTTGWEHWCEELPGYNIGVACGDGTVVVDIDPRNGGDASLDDWLTWNDPDLLPETLRIRTGGGGTHLIYRAPPGVEVRSSKWLPGIDVQAQGKLVVAAGSLHASGLYYVPEDGSVPVAVLPTEFIEKELSKASRASRGQSDRVDLGALLDGVPEGARNQTLFDAAWQLRWDKRLDEATVHTVIIAAARASTPPYPDDLAADVVRRVYSYDDRPLDAGNVLLFPGAEDWAKSRGAHPSGQPALGEGEDEQQSPAGLLFPCTDMGNAARLVRHAHMQLRYVEGWGWLVWDGARWTRETLGVEQELVKETVIRMAQEEQPVARPDEKELQKWVKTSQSARSVGATLKLASSDPAFARRVDDFDQDDWLLNTPSGVVNLRTGEIEEPDPARLVTKVAGARFSAGDGVPGWLTFLERIMPQEDTRALLQRAVGYSLTGDTSAKAMFILWGSGNNGKSVFLEVLRHVLGDYATTAQKSVFVERRGDAHTTDVASLHGARFVTFSEVSKGERLSTDVIKQITGGDEIAARYMRQDQFTFHPKCKLWLATNHKPGVHDFGLGMRTRLRLIPFTESIPAEEQENRDVLIDKLVGEGPGILNWALQGLAAWRVDGWLGETPDMEAAKEEWLDEEDSFAQFMEECLEVRDDWVTRNSSIVAVHRDWCARQGIDRPMSGVALGRELSTRGVKKARGKTWRGFYARVTEVARTPTVVMQLEEWPDA